MKSFEELESHFNTALKPDLDVLEKKREDSLSKMNIVTFGSVSLTAVIAYFSFSWAFVAGIIFYAVYKIIQGQEINKYNKDFKMQVIGGIVKFIDQNLNYDPDRSISRNTYTASKLFLQNYERYWGDDYVFGSIGKTKIEFSELHVQDKVKDQSARTIFEGLFFVGDFNKNFKTQMVVLPDVAEKSFGQYLGNIFQSLNKGRGTLMKMDDPEFEKLFVVYGNDQIEARYILTPDLMKRIVDYRKKTDKEIRISFMNNNIFVAISCIKNFFEPDISNSVYDYPFIREYYQDLRLAADLVESLNLNTRIWTRE